MEDKKPWTNKNHRYAVAVQANGCSTLLESYETLEQLKEGYRDWKEFASKRKTAEPVPIEFIKIEGRNGKCRVLTDLINHTKIS